MKKLACELCGSTDIVKQDGLFICQACGTKYSTEEAKKMMIGGTVTIDRSSENENLKILAKRYYDNGEFEKADDYYDRLIEADPHDWEAVYYGGLASAYRSSFGNLRLSEAVIGAENALNLVDDDEKEEKIEEFRKDLIQLVVTHGNWLNGLYSADSFSENDVATLIGAYDEIISLSVRILSSFPPKKVVKNDQVFIFYSHITKWCEKLTKTYKYNWGYYTNSGATKYEYFTPNTTIQNAAISVNKIYSDKLAELDDSYVKKELKTNSGGCYIATSVYGSYDCPEVWTLRRFRDNILAKTFYGRLFIKTYYAISPTLVKYFGNQKWFNNLFKPRLDKLVIKLQNEGVESTFYIDE